MRRRSLPVAILVLALAFARPGHAGILEDSWNRSVAILESSVSILESSAQAVLAPIQAAAQWTRRQLRLGEHSLASALRGLATTLRDDLDRFETLAGRAGFRLTNVIIKPGLIPEIELGFEPAEDISPEAEAALRAELAQMGGVLGALEREVILMLLDIDERVEEIRPRGFRIGEVGLALIAIIPELSFTFVRGEAIIRGEVVSR